MCAHDISYVAFAALMAAAVVAAALIGAALIVASSLAPRSREQEDKDNNEG